MLEIKEILLKLLSKYSREADYLEVRAGLSRGLSVNVENGVLKGLSRTDKLAVGVRALVGGCWGISFTDTPSEGELEGAFKRAISSARALSTKVGGEVRLSEEKVYTDAKEREARIRFEDVDVEEKLGLVSQLDRAIRGPDKRIVNCKVSYIEGYSEKVFLNSEGVDVEYDKTGAGFSICLAVYEGEVGSEGFRSRSTVYWDDLKLLENIAEVSELTSKTLRPEKIEPGVYTVVLAPDAAYSILSLIGFAVNADNVRKKRSPWTGRIGQRVASEKLTVIDDALLPRGRETAPCDGEGYPMRRKTVIEKGVLKTYLYDYYTARLMGTESTGNASSERPPPSISTTNVIVEPGSRTPEELIGEVERGVYIPRLPPLLANPVTGDFSAELRQAFTIEGGELGKPVRWGMLAGSVYHMLERITEVASDQTMIGSYLVPTVMVENVRIAG